MVVEAPGADPLAQAEQFRHLSRVHRRAQHAVEGGEMLRRHFPATAAAACAQQRPATVDQDIGRAQERAGPDAFALDHRVETELALAWLRQAEVDAITEILPGEAQAQVHRLPAHAAFDRLGATAHGPADVLRSRPQGRWQAALARQRRDHFAARAVRQQAQGPVDVGLAGAVGAGDQVQAPQRHHQVAQGAVVGHRQGGQHGCSRRNGNAADCRPNAASLT
ncbi:hypothetical protein PAERUG_E16_London_17_VIM_2_04_14_01531 [Pseudomonas aeruginosa]|nr:hypothetical protein PAERUG_E16_London_17_VIM_2_04_14_01531 [Pseudomonas aeruginosa]